MLHIFRLVMIKINMFEMDYSITKRIFAHRMITPPDQMTDSFVDFTFINMQYLDITLISQTSQSILQIKIDNPRQIQFKHIEDDQSYQEFRNLLLSMNLCMNKACISSNQQSFTDYNLNVKPTNPTTSSWNKEGNEFHVEMEDRIVLRDSIRVGITTKEVFDEKKVIEVFKNIQNFESSKTNNQSSHLATHQLDIEKSLSSFTDSMEPLNLVAKFKNMYTSLELIVNSDGQNRDAQKLDTEVSNLANVPIQKVTDWRKFNNRTKHIDNAISDIQTYVNLKQELPQILPKLRQCCNEIILLRLSTYV